MELNRRRPKFNILANDSFETAGVIKYLGTTKDCKLSRFYPITNACNFKNIVAYLFKKASRHKFDDVN